MSTSWRTCSKRNRWPGSRRPASRPEPLLPSGASPPEPPSRSGAPGSGPLRPGGTPTPGWRGHAGLPPLLLACVVLSGCSPLYVIRAGIAEAKILAARRPIPEVVLDPATDEDTRGKLVLAMEARRFARDSLDLDVGKSYTSFTRLKTDTLVMVLSAAYPDRLEPRTWWFPVVGHVPYKGYFDFEAAAEAERDLQRDGFDTQLRPTGAFSTLGWFADPLLSTLLRLDHVDLVETILHELSHNHLFLPGHVQFNESYATFVGRVGAVEFFCGREGGGPDTVKCLRARARWRDAMRYSHFLDGMVADLQAVYRDPALTREQKLERREEVFLAHRARFQEEVQPGFESLRFGALMSRPVNNALLLGQMRYYHRLPAFQAWYEAHGEDLGPAVEALVEAVDGTPDPWTVLPAGDPTAH